MIMSVTAHAQTSNKHIHKHTNNQKQINLDTYIHKLNPLSNEE